MEKVSKLIYFCNCVSLHEQMAFCCNALDTLCVYFVRKKFRKKLEGPYLCNELKGILSGLAAAKET